MSLSALQIVRPLNLALTFASVLLGGWLADPNLTRDLILAAISATAIAGAGYIHNDVLDLESDRVSHPDRPLPNELLRPRFAIGLAYGAYTAGLSVAMALPIGCTVVAVTVAVLLILYNQSLKSLPLVGNLAVGLIGGAPFLFGGLAVENAYPSLPPTLLAISVHFAREVVKDLQDRTGDEHVASRTLAVVAAPRIPKALASLALIAVVIAIPVPGFTAMAGPVYLAIGLPLAGLLILTICLVWQADHESDFQLPSALLKAVMIAGILAFLLDSLAS